MTSASLSCAQSLGEILSKEQASCLALLDTVEEERRAIKSLAVAEFHGVNTKRIAILETLQSLNQSREAAVRQLAEAVHLPAAADSLRTLLDTWRSPAAEGLRREYEALMTTAKRAREEIKQNVVLIESLREFLEGAVQAGTVLSAHGQAYDRSGQRVGAASSAAVLYQQG